MYSKKIVPHKIFIQIINLIFVSLKSRLFSLWLTERLPWMFTICYKQLFTNHYTTWMILYTNCSFAFNHHRPTRLVLVLISTNWIFVFEEGPTHPQWVLSLSIGPPCLNRENRELVSIMVLKITCILLTVTFKEKQFDNIHKSWNW